MKKTSKKVVGRKTIPAPERPKGLYKKLAAIQAEIGTIAKLGRNQTAEYNYVRESDVLAAVSEQMKVHGLVLDHSVKSVIAEKMELHRVPGRLVRVEIQLRWVDIDATGPEATKSFTAYGEGWDLSDKALPKAITQAIKYALLKQFLVSTGEDAEASELAKVHAPASDRVAVNGANGQTRNVSAPRPVAPMAAGKHPAIKLSETVLSMLDGDKDMARAAFKWLTGHDDVKAMEKKPELCEVLQRKLDDMLRDDLRSAAESQIKEEQTAATK